MLTSTATYKQAIHFPHKRRTVIDVVDASGAVLASDIPFNDGAVKASLTQRVTRQADITVSEDLFPDLDTDPLSPTHAILNISSGIEYPDGSVEIFPVFHGRVQEPTLNPDGSVSISAEDRALDVVGMRFEQPRNHTPGTVIQMIHELITEAVPGAVFGTDDVADAPVPELTWDEDRGQAVDDLAEALGARWYAQGDGAFVVRAFPYDDGTVVQTLEDGEEGLLSDATLHKSRSGTANSVTVVSERLDGTDPVRVTARNTVPTSSTQYGDTFGRVTQIIKIQTPLTSSEAQRLARAQLNAATALIEQWTLTCTPDHTLEPGDPIRIRSRGRTTVQVIDSIAYPLGTGSMSIATRAFTTLPVTL
jgi:hypothetical protein